MSPLSLPLLWAAVGDPAVRPVVPEWLQWVYIWGDPGFTDARPFGGVITWTKIVGLFCLLGWVASWLSVRPESRLGAVPKGRGMRLGLLAGGLGFGLLAILVTVLRDSGRMPSVNIAKVPLATLLASAAVATFVLLGEWVLWSNVRRVGRLGDAAVLFGLHLGLAAGVAVSALIQRFGGVRITPVFTLTSGARMGASFMGLVVLARVAWLVLVEASGVRGRRLFAIARLTWAEAFRRMWAPWVVLAVFGVILAFTDWFLTPPRPAELGRLYVGTLTLLTSLLLTVMVTILAPISLPQDIQAQTIYTVVSKPVRRLELVLGRILGFMALVTFLLAIVGGASLLYLERTVGGAITESERQSAKYAQSGSTNFARQFAEQADQLRTRMSARVPVYGSLTFLDSRGLKKRFGIDVGQDQGTSTRSFVEGATASAAVWNFGVFPSPDNAEQILDKRLPLERLLVAGSIEERENRISELNDVMAEADRRRQSPGFKGADAGALGAEITRARAEADATLAELKALRDREQEIRKAARAATGAAAAELEAQAERLHSPPVGLEMVFTVYRTTKGDIGEPVYAALVVKNPRPNVAPHRAWLPIHEYYTDKQMVPSRVLVGSRGFLTVEVQCLSQNQYLGMATSDLYFVARQGRFWDNYLRGLFGVWLQAMVLTAIGVFAGTFLSWPVALVTTMAFFVAGQAAYGFLQTIALQSLEGGGPFESLIRLLSHENMQNDLDPTLSVILAKTSDALVMPVLSRLVYIVPNFAGLDVSNTVADGYAVTWGAVGWNLVLAIAYVAPFAVAGYFILKHREVAA